MIETGNIEVKRDKDGMWWHPAFPWDDVPEETSPADHIKEWGYEAKFFSLEDHAPPEIADRYFEAGEPDCSYWEPKKPTGDGWILGAIYDTEDGPCAIWLRPLTHNVEFSERSAAGAKSAGTEG